MFLFPLNIYHFISCWCIAGDNNFSVMPLHGWGKYLHVPGNLSFSLCAILGPYSKFRCGMCISLSCISFLRRVLNCCMMQEVISQMKGEFSTGRTELLIELLIKNFLCQMLKLQHLSCKHRLRAEKKIFLYWPTLTLSKIQAKTTKVTSYL